MGQLRLSAISTAIAYDIFGMPLGIYLAFSKSTSLGLVGIWCGLATSIYAVVSVLPFYFMIA